jgi:hypothetical protein
MTFLRKYIKDFSKEFLFLEKPCSSQFLIKNNKEFAPESSGCPYSLLLKTIRNYQNIVLSNIESFRFF